jgi:hypothetical protein
VQEYKEGSARQPTGRKRAGLQDRARGANGS